MSSYRTSRIVSLAVVSAFTLLASILLQSVPAISQTVSDVVSQVSETQYRQYHYQLENAGLGWYGGSAYNNGSRSRRWHEPAPANLGNLEAQLIIADAFRACPRLIVWVPQGSKQNVMAELPGEDPARANEVYIISGHFDTTADSNRPGGDDNASGTAGVMEAARVMSQYHFGATIRFIAFNAEEGWHGGSLEYVGDLTPEQKLLHKGVVNMDMILHGRDDRTGHTSDPYDIDLWSDLSQPAQVTWMNQFVQAAATYVPALLVDASYDNRASSDHESFYLNLIPAFTLIEFDVAAWQGGANKEYHTSSDYSLYEPNGSGKGYLKDLHWSYPFATNIVKASVALVADKAGLAPEVYDAAFTNVGESQVTITWNSRTAGQSYVEYGLTEDFGQTVYQPAPNTTSHSVTLTGLQPQALYYCRAVTVGSGGPRYSKTMAVQLSKVPLISGVAVKTRSNTTATIVWNTDTPASSKVDYGPTAAYALTSGVVSTPVLAHQTSLTGLTPSTTYHFRVTSGTSVGSASSEDFVFTTLASAPGVDGTPPSTPLNGSTLIYSPSQIRVSWSASTDNVGVTGYDVYTDRYLESTSRLYSTVNGLTPNTQYTFRVAAYDDAGNRSPKGTPVSGTTKCRPPSAATIACDQQPGLWLSDPQVTFGAIGGFGQGTVSHYTYQWVTSPTAVFDGDEPVWQTADLSVTVAPDGAAHYLHLVGYNSAGFENGRYTVGPFLYDPTAPVVSAPAAPRKFVPAGEQINISWNASDAESGITDTQIRLVDSGGQGISDWAAAPTGSVQVTVPAAGIDFRVQVRGRNGAGAWSETGSTAVMTAASRVASPAAARLAAQGSAVLLEPVSITTNSGQYLYCQKPGQYSGVRVLATSPLPIGRSVSVGGIVGASGDTRLLAFAEAVDLGADAPVSPAAINARFLGGVALGAGNIGVDGALGPHNIGTLVSFVGEVTRSEASDTFVYLKDGTGITDETGLGVRVEWPGARPGVGSVVCIDAISHYRENAGVRYPALILQQAGAFETLVP